MEDQSIVYNIVIPEPRKSVTNAKLPRVVRQALTHEPQFSSERELNEADFVIKKKNKPSPPISAYKKSTAIEQDSDAGKSFFITELLNEMGNYTLYLIKSRFDDCGGSVSLDMFVEIVCSSLQSKHVFERQLRELFTEIDINGDGKLSWEEFTTFIIKNGVLPSDEGSINMLKRYVESESGEEIRFQNLEKIKYFTKLDKIVVCDHSKVVKLYKPMGNQTHQQEYTLVKELRGHQGAILNAEHISDYNLNYLCTSSTDSSLLLWDCTTNYRQKSEISQSYPQLSLTYNSQFHTLYSGGTDGIVHMWNFEEFSEKNRMRERHLIEAHKDMVMDLQLITNTPLVASASLDSKIMLWDTNVGSMHTEMSGHVKGVFSLAYAPEHRLLFSASFDRDVFVWNPMVEALVFKLKGHHTSLVGVQAIEGTPQIVSADMDGIFKVWDIRTFECIQSFTSSAGIQGLRSFTAAPPYNQVLAGTKVMHTFQWNRPGKPWLTADDPITSVIYNELFHAILTAEGRDVRIWDAETGKLQRSFTVISEHKITAVCLDGRMRKIIVGNTKGHIRIHNFKNGALLRTLDSHASEVSTLLYGASKSIISGSWDSKVSIHNELLPHHTNSVVRSIHCSEKDVVFVTYSRVLSLFACSDSACNVKIFDYDTMSPEIAFKNDHELTCMILGGPFPLLFFADTTGMVHVWSVRPAPIKNQYLAKFLNKNADEDPTAVHSMIFDAKTQNLIAGDEKGSIFIWNLSVLIEEQSIEAHSKHRKKAVSKAAIRKSSSLAEGTQGIALVRSWKAHTLSIVTMTEMGDTGYILSGSTDCLVKAWDSEGNELGTLKQSEENLVWNIPGFDVMSDGKEKMEAFEASDSKPKLSIRRSPKISTPKDQPIPFFDINADPNATVTKKSPKLETKKLEHFYLPHLNSNTHGPRKKDMKEENFMSFMEEKGHLSRLNDKQMEVAERLHRALRSIDDA